MNSRRFLCHFLLIVLRLQEQWDGGIICLMIGIGRDSFFYFLSESDAMYSCWLNLVAYNLTLFEIFRPIVHDIFLDIGLSFRFHHLPLSCNKTNKILTPKKDQRYQKYRQKPLHSSQKIHYPKNTKNKNYQTLEKYQKPFMYAVEIGFLCVGNLACGLFWPFFSRFQWHF